MTRTYECMFLLDNDAVRAGWNDAKSSVSSLVSKHGGSVVTARRWDERRLAYPIRHKNRATYLLTYCELDAPQIEELRNELDISETVLRYLILATDAVPAEERELSEAEQSPEFELPEPPADDAIDVVPSAETEEKSEGETPAADGEATQEKPAEASSEASDAAPEVKAPVSAAATAEAEEN